MRNAGIVIVAVAVLAVGFVLATGAGDEGSTTSAGVTTTQATAAPAASTPSASTAAPTTSTEAAPAPEPAIPTVVFAGGEVEGGVQTLSFDKGEQVRFKIRSDVDEEIHVHGFDRYVDLEAGKTRTVSFPAKFDGAYEVELHDAGKQIASLEIQP